MTIIIVLEAQQLITISNRMSVSLSAGVYRRISQTAKPIRFSFTVKHLIDSKKVYTTLGEGGGLNNYKFLRETTLEKITPFHIFEIMFLKLYLMKKGLSL